MAVRAGADPQLPATPPTPTRRSPRCAELGAIVERRDGELLIRGCGLRNAQPPPRSIDVGNAGTLMRLLPGWLAFQQGQSFTLDGDESIRRRPVDRIAEPLRLMGARIEAREGRFPPFTVHGASLRGIEYELPVASAQVKSCVLLAGLVTDGTTVIEPVPARDHTERMLLRRGRAGDRARATRRGGYRDHGGQLRRARARRDRRSPATCPRAAFLIAAGVLVRGSRLVLEDVGVNWTRTGFLRILERMGAIVLGDARAARRVLGAPSRSATSTSAAAPIEATTVDAPTRCRWPSTSCRWWRCWAALPRARRWSAGRPSSGSRSQTGSPPWSTACAGWAPTSRRSRTGSSCAGTGGLRGGRLDAHGDHRLALLGAVAGLASRGGRRGRRDGGRRRVLPGLRRPTSRGWPA